MRKALIASAFFILPRLAAAQSRSTATFMGLDVYRSEVLTDRMVQEKLGGLLAGYLRTQNDGRPSVLKQGDRLHEKLEQSIGELGRFAFVSLRYAQFYSSLKKTAYLTLDIVDAKDAKERMPFRAAPQGAVTDPAGLLAAWQGYNGLGIALQKRGELSTAERPNCPGFYCTWGAGTPQLADFEKRLAEGATPNKVPLKQLVENDADPRKRAAALFVFSYVQDAKEVSELMTRSLDDPAEEVRAAALLVLSDLALFHKYAFIEVNKVIPALDFPTLSDRNKALGVLVGLADNPTYKPYVLDRATPHLLRLLRMKQPSVHDLAFTVLTLVSGKALDRRDYEGWDAWWRSQQASPPTPPQTPTRRR